MKTNNKKAEDVLETKAETKIDNYAIAKTILNQVWQKAEVQPRNTTMKAPEAEVVTFIRTLSFKKLSETETAILIKSNDNPMVKLLVIKTEDARKVYLAAKLFVKKDKAPVVKSIDPKYANLLEIATIKNKGEESAE